MNPPGVIKIHIMLNTEAELRQVDIHFDSDVLIFQRHPKNLSAPILRMIVNIYLLTIRKAPKSARSAFTPVK